VNICFIKNKKIKNSSSGSRLSNEISNWIKL